MRKVKKDSLELTKEGVARFDKAIERVHKACEEWKKKYGGFKDEKNKTP